MGHDRQTLLELRADLRNLKGVALSVNNAATLEIPILLGQLYAAFNEKLRGRFDARCPPNEWAFDVFIEFLTHEISYIDSLHHMQVDLRDTSKWQESEKQRLVPWPNKRLPHKQVASVVERNKQHTAIGGDPPENIEEFKRSHSPRSQFTSFVAVPEFC